MDAYFRASGRSRYHCSNDRFDITNHLNNKPDYFKPSQETPKKKHLDREWCCELEENCDNRLPHLDLLFRNEVVTVNISTGSCISIVDYEFAFNIGMKIYPLSAQEKNRIQTLLPLSVEGSICGAIDVKLRRTGFEPLTLNAVVLDHQNSEIVGGMPFCEDNAIAIDFAHSDLVINDSGIIHYGCNSQSSTCNTRYSHVAIETSSKKLTKTTIDYIQKIFGRNKCDADYSTSKHEVNAKVYGISDSDSSEDDFVSSSCQSDMEPCEEAIHFDITEANTSANNSNTFPDTKLHPRYGRDSGTIKCDADTAADESVGVGQHYDINEQSYSSDNDISQDIYVHDIVYSQSCATPSEEAIPSDVADTIVLADDAMNTETNTAVVNMQQQDIGITKELKSGDIYSQFYASEEVHIQTGDQEFQDQSLYEQAVLLDLSRTGYDIGIPATTATDMNSLRQDIRVNFNCSKASASHDIHEGDATVQSRQDACLSNTNICYNDLKSSSVLPCSESAWSVQDNSSAYFLDTLTIYCISLHRANVCSNQFLSEKPMLPLTDTLIWNQRTRPPETNLVFTLPSGDVHDHIGLWGDTIVDITHREDEIAMLLVMITSCLTMLSCKIQLKASAAYVSSLHQRRWSPALIWNQRTRPPEASSSIFSPFGEVMITLVHVVTSVLTSNTQK